MKKTIEYRLLFALKVIQRDPNARVLYATGTKQGATEAWTTLMNLPGKPSGLTFNLQTRCVTHENGGSLKVGDTENIYDLAGMQLSHIWVDEIVNEQKRAFLASRIRASRQYPIGPEGMGLYDDWCVRRTEDY